MSSRVVVYRIAAQQTVERAPALRSLVQRWSPLALLQKLIFWYIIQRYFFKSIRHLRARGPLNTLMDHYNATAATLYSYILRLPKVRTKVAKELASARIDMENKLATYDGKLGLSRNLALPEEGKDIEWLNDELAKMEGMHGSSEWKEGRVSGAVYHGEGGKVEEATRTAVLKYLLSNPLHPEVFPEVRKMEAEVVQMILDMYNAPAGEGCGTTTSGGTESILLACKTYRDWAKKTKSITEPEMVIPVSAHAAFDKASAYFKIKLHKIPVDNETRQVDLKRLKRALNKNTIMIVGSACNFGDGIIDDIPALSEIALKAKIGLHVDCCLGSFLVPFLHEAGYTTVPFDFRLDGVTSISCDAHKYGFAPKGVSTIMYRSKALRRHQYYVSADWPGGVYASPTVAGSRPGSIIAGAWATLMVTGRQGYIDSCRDIVGCRQRIEAAVRSEIPEITVMGKPLVSVIAFRSEVVNILEVGDRMSKLGWHLNALQNPAALHICVTRLTVPKVAEFVGDLKKTVRQTLASPSQDKGTMVTLYGLGTSNAAGPALVSELAAMYIDTLFVPGSNAEEK